VNAIRRALALWAGQLMLAGLLTSCTSGPYTDGPYPPPRMPSCGTLLPFFALDREGGHEPTIYGQQFGNALLYIAGLRIDADGAPNAYSPDDKGGLDRLANAGEPGRWWGLATDQFGRPFIQTGVDEFPGFYVSKTALTDPDVGDAADPHRYVDARAVPFVVLPGGSRAATALRDAGMKLGDLAIVYNLRTKRMTPAIWADNGPPTRLGEGSIRLAAKLGYTDMSPRTGGTSVRENVFLLFPGSSIGFPRSQEKIDDNANELFMTWGGPDRLMDCARYLQAR
jgi:Fungal chitosanase of glycosyl hydrolase group 75